MNQLDAGNVVLLSNLGFTAAGEVLNCNTYDVGLHAAVEVSALLGWRARSSAPPAWPREGPRLQSAALQQRGVERGRGVERVAAPEQACQMVRGDGEVSWAAAWRGGRRSGVLLRGAARGQRGRASIAGHVCASVLGGAAAATSRLRVAVHAWRAVCAAQLGADKLFFLHREEVASLNLPEWLPLSDAQDLLVKALQVRPNPSLNPNLGARGWVDRVRRSRQHGQFVQGAVSPRSGTLGRPAPAAAAAATGGHRVSSSCSCRLAAQQRPPPASRHASRVVPHGAELPEL